MAEVQLPVAEVFRWAESMAAIARTGLAFSKDPYDHERFEQVLEIAGDMIASVSAEAPAKADQVEAWLASVGTGIYGYVTPKVGVGAYVGNERGELLLVKRSDNHRWYVPTGWADVGYSAAEVAMKEVAEECGLDVKPIDVAAVIDNMQAGSSIPHYTLIFTCELLGGELRAHPIECEDIGWFAQDALPDPLLGTGRWVPRAFAAIRGELEHAWFDVPREPVWRPKPG